jgi:hypothetical protein
MTWYDNYKVTEIEPGRVGNVAVEKFEVSPATAQLHVFTSCLSGMGGRGIRAGHYTRLVEINDGGGKLLWMSDTPAEITDHSSLFGAVRSGCNGVGPSVLLHGLGLGVALKGCMLSGARHVTVVERNPEVIELVGSQWKKIYGDSLELINDDALTWKPRPKASWDVVWHDIWPEINMDNLETMSKLHRRFGSRSRWQGSWGRWQIKRMQRDERDNVRIRRFW